MAAYRRTWKDKLRAGEYKSELARLDERWAIA